LIQLLQERHIRSRIKENTEMKEIVL